MTRLPPFVVVSVIGAIAVFSVLKVEFSANLYEMLPSDLPEVVGMDRVSRYFNRDGQLVVTVKASESYLADAAVEDLATAFENEPELFGDVFRELSLTELVTEGGGLLAWLWLNATPETFSIIADRLGEGASLESINGAMETLQSGFFDQGAVIASYDPLGFSRLSEALGESFASGSETDPMASEDGTFQVIYVEGSGVDFSSYREAAEWLTKVKSFVAAWEADWLAKQEAGATVSIGLTGTPAFMAEVGKEMERDMTISVFATMILISVLFWIMHRRSNPLAWLVSAMLLILAITLNIGGLVFGKLSVMSAGFAAILMGLAVDYGIVIYREAMDGKRDAKALRRAVGPSILWAAATTAAVFLSLNLSSMRGLSEMGNLVAIGVAVGALVMLYVFAPVALSFARDTKQEAKTSLKGNGVSGPWAGVIAVVIPFLAFFSMVGGAIPSLEPNFHPFRIRESPSMKSWQQLQSELSGRENSVPTVISAPTIDGLIDEIESLDERVDSARQSGLIRSALLPTQFIPHPTHQQANRERLLTLFPERERLFAEIGGAGFSEDGSALTETVFDAWENYAAQLSEGDYAMPTGKLATWSINRLFSTEGGTFAALATVKPILPRDREWVGVVCKDQVAAASLGSLGTALNERIRGDIKRVFLPMMAILAVMLGIVFRDWRDLVLSLFSLLFAASVMVILTVWTPMSWNSFNVCGLPLLFGTGLDFGIHMIFALRREKGDLVKARRGIGRALLFCGTSSAIGFGSLAMASAYGLASLGVVCAIGILINMLVAVWLLPRWYRWMHRSQEAMSPVSG